MLASTCNKSRRAATFVVRTDGALNRPGSEIGSTCNKSRQADAFVVRTDGALIRPAGRIGSAGIKCCGADFVARTDSARVPVAIISNRIPQN
jgi:hypothetical protein